MSNKPTEAQRKEFRHKVKTKLLFYLNAGLSAITLIIGVLVLLAAETTGKVMFAAVAITAASVIAIIQEVIIILMGLNKRTMFVSVSCIFLYVAIIVLTYATTFHLDETGIAIVTVALTSVYIFVRLGKTIFLLVQAKSKGWIINTILIGALLTGSIIYLGCNYADALNVLYYVGVFLIIEEVIIFFISILSSSSAVRFIRILVRTHVAEALFGLLFFMVVSSIILEMVEPDQIATFGDAMWFCFQTITTIGFGDFKIHSFAGRIIIVLLGIYGIVIVALFTSLIVNLYNDSLDKETKKADDTTLTDSFEDKKKK